MLKIGNGIIYTGDCLDIMDLIDKGSIDLIYIDPPFGIKQDEKFGMVPWKKTNYYDEWVYIHFGDFLDEATLKYLSFIRPRLVKMRELLSERGSIYVHLDWHVGHYVKIMMDEVFGKSFFRNEIVWSYFRYTAKSQDFQKMHDTIFRYTKSKDTIFNQLYSEYQETTLKYHKWEYDNDGKEFYWKRGNNIKPYKIFKSEGVALNDVWAIPQIGPIGKERIGYCTQKPEILLTRILKASSNEESLVADFFSGSGTTAAVAERLGRRWIACDSSENATSIIAKRIRDMQKIDTLL